MPDRILRAALLSSERFLQLPRNSHRLAYIALLLHGDSLGNLEAGDGHLWRIWRDWCALTAREQVADILSALVGADLVRLYWINAAGGVELMPSRDGTGKRFLHIPRYGQRLRYIRRICPPSPWQSERELRAISAPNDGEAVDNSFGAKQNQTLALNSPRRAPGAHPAEVKRSEEVQNRASNNRGDTSNGEPVDNSGKQVKIAIGNNTMQTALTATGQRIQTQTGNGQQWNSPAWVNATGATLGLEPRSRESATDYRDRVYTELAKRNRKAR